MQQSNLVLSANPSALFMVFDKAAQTRSNPSLVMGTIVVYQAALDSANPGCLYVKIREHYVGKIIPTGFFVPAYDNRSAHSEKVTTFMANLIQDPLTVLTDYGKWSKRCACCHRKLTDPKSIDAGIGPICQRNWGM